MLLKYSTFAVKAPGRIELFSGTRGEERETYEKLRTKPNAELLDCNIRVGDLGRTVRALAAHTFSRPGNVMWPDEIRRIVDSHPHSAVTFEGDLDGETTLIRIFRDSFRPSLTASFRDPGTRILNVVKIAVVTIRGATVMYDIFRQTIQAVDSSVSGYELTNLHAAVLLASDRRLVCVTELDCVYCEQALRLVHAVAAFLAQSGMISGASIVAINMRGNRFGPPAGLIQCAQNSPYQLKRIGRLMVAKADSFVAPSLTYRTLRNSELGASPSALVVAEQARRSRG
jgi:hypothetical protein